MAQRAGQRAYSTPARNDGADIGHVRDVRPQRTFVKPVGNVRRTFHNLWMENAIRTGAALRALRERAGLTMHQVAKGAGYRGRSSVQSYFDAEYDRPLSLQAATALADAFEGLGQPPISRAEVMALAGFEGNATAVRFEGASADRMRPDLPVLGTGLGSDVIYEGEAIEQTTLNTGDVIGYVKRPAILNGVATAYGLYLQGSSMYPVHPEGSLVVADQRKPPRVGDDVVVYMRANGDGDDGDNGERARCVLVKRLVRRNASDVELEQFNPPLRFKVPATDIVRIDRVMTLGDLLG